MRDAPCVSASRDTARHRSVRPVAVTGRSCFRRQEGICAWRGEADRRGSQSTTALAGRTNPSRRRRTSMTNPPNVSRPVSGLSRLTGRSVPASSQERSGARESCVPQTHRLLMGPTACPKTFPRGQPVTRTGTVPQTGTSPQVPGTSRPSSTPSRRRRPRRLAGLVQGTRTERRTAVTAAAGRTAGRGRRRRRRRHGGRTGRSTGPSFLAPSLSRAARQVTARSHRRRHARSRCGWSCSSPGWSPLA